VSGNFPMLPVTTSPGLLHAADSRGPRLVAEIADTASPGVTGGIGEAYAGLIVAALVLDDVE
jgi:hypothetical protein